MNKLIRWHNEFILFVYEHYAVFTLGMIIFPYVAWKKNERLDFVLFFIWSLFVFTMFGLLVEGIKTVVSWIW